MGHHLGQICVVVRRVDQTPSIPKMVPAQMVQKMDPAQMVQKMDPELQGLQVVRVVPEMIARQQ